MLSVDNKVHNFMTIDVEDWHHANYDNCSQQNVDVYKWDLEDTVLKMIDQAAEFKVKLTCFILGSVAVENPNIVYALHRAGHEIASHGVSHQAVYSLEPEQFREDVRLSKKILEDLSGGPVCGFRAPSWSVRKENLEWFYDILTQEGYIYSSSVYPALTYLYGIPEFPEMPGTYRTKDNSCFEVPNSTLNVLGKKIGFAGGFYLRLFPYWFVKRGVNRKNSIGQPVFFYTHPRELDPDSPRIELGLLDNFVHHYNLKSTKRKLISAMKDFSFVRMIDFVNGHLEQ